MIAAGRVRVGGHPVGRAGSRCAPDAEVTVDYPATRYVSRGGAKLEKALTRFGIDVAGLVCLDVGASTGGFTDCLLSRGARRVYAVDVGYGLLAWSLRSDPRVVTLDRTNARYLNPETFRAAVELQLARRSRRSAARPGRPSDPAGIWSRADEGPPADERPPGEDERPPGEDGGSASFLWPSFACCDVSFISLLKVVPAVASVLVEPWQMVLLVKPQFEAGREKVGRRGVVRDPEVHVEVLLELGRRLTGGPTGACGDKDDAGIVQGAEIAGLTFSPVRGPQGNIEYLLWLRKPGGPARQPWGPATVRAVVEEALAELGPPGRSRS